MIRARPSEVRHGRRRAAPQALFLCLSFALGCAELPYQPEEVVLAAHEPTFAVVVEAVRSEFPDLIECDVPARRLQSAWLDVDDGAVPGRRRVTVFPTGPDRVGIVVERQWLRMTLTGQPYWTDPAADSLAERRLADAVRDRLAPRSLGF